MRRVANKQKHQCMATALFAVCLLSLAVCMCIFTDWKFLPLAECCVRAACVQSCNAHCCYGNLLCGQVYYIK